MLILYILAATQSYILFIKLYNSKQVNSYKILVLDIYRIYIIDFINRIVQVLKGDLYWFKISVQDTRLMEPVEP